ncbi:succinate dehydrogenase, hydrophobic membrane anchor protein, partial [Brevundimonas sp.]|uniref:succinate dehydrogenase, hydrophobic membrane anchor protein n=1 Tax=Brevundimonas sp. TaxID=1871086 RepID=UPI00391BF55D
EWTAERLSALALAPRGRWGAGAGFELAGGGYAGALAWLAQPVNSTLLVLTLLVSFWHMNMGFKVIVEDYIHRPATRGLLLGLSGLLCLVLSAASVFFIVRLALGSAPLPAGFGA